MSSDVTVTGDDPLVAGIRLSLRLRQDFTVTDPDRLLAAARDAYRELNPDADIADAEVMVTGAADALFTLLEQAGLFGDRVDDRLAAHTVHGLTLGGSCQQIVIDDPAPLAPGPRSNCLRQGDVFALPPEER